MTLTTYLIVTVLLLISAGIFKGMMDAVADEGIKGFEWEKKYDLTRSERNHWWYLGLHTPSHPERFPFSSTALVFLTDDWHLYQFCMMRCYHAIISLWMAGNMFTFALFMFLIPIITGGAFELVYESYRKTLRKRYTKTPYSPTGDEPQHVQVTSVPEKQIEDEELS